MNFTVNDIFSIDNNSKFNELCLKIFLFQAENCPVYKRYIELINIDPHSVNNLAQIPMLPIRLFKSHKVVTLAGGKEWHEEALFTSSATTGMIPSKHYVKELNIYEKSFLSCFNTFYGSPKDYAILALLPSYLERKGSSLVYMADRLINAASDGGFYLYNHKELYDKLLQLKQKHVKTILLGVTFALIDFVKEYRLNFPDLIVMETGGMKGHGEEIEREALHKMLCNGFGTNNIHSEYGMAELLSQAYSMGDGIFKTPNWMKIIISDPNDPFNREVNSGRINIIDLANIYSCSFIESEDKGRLLENDTFTIDGRLKNAELRGCNMLIE